MTVEGVYSETARQCALQFHHPVSGTAALAILALLAATTILWLLIRRIDPAQRKRSKMAGFAILTITFFAVFAVIFTILLQNACYPGHV